ncbi:hypothetical protein SCG7109_AO_00220 [Chlamydiales bacterium SCGC AG-110-M15]|nr:hypothetical protein SCG7109_AO_00220 [Chlamydiales bacterium SCGC AG-110-M15]
MSKLSKSIILVLTVLLLTVSYSAQATYPEGMDFEMPPVELPPVEVPVVEVPVVEVPVIEVPVIEIITPNLDNITAQSSDAIERAIRDAQKQISSAQNQKTEIEHCDCPSCECFIHCQTTDCQLGN